MRIQTIMLMTGTALVLTGAVSTNAQAMNLAAPSTMAAAQGSSVDQTGVVAVAANRSEAAKGFIEQMAKRGIDFLANPNLTLDQRKAEFKSLLQSSFDTKAIGRFAMGRYWNSASDKQKNEYQSLFDRMIVDVYSRRFGEYNGQQFEVLSAREQGASDAIVSSRIVDKSGQNIAVDWRVREKGGSYKVIDVIVEGVSMATTQRSEFASIIQRGGGQIQVLIDHLKG